MLSKSQLVQGSLLVAVIADGIKMRIDRKKAADLYIASHEAFEEERKTNEEQIRYLCHMLDKNEIPADEFDLIALNYHM